MNPTVPPKLTGQKLTATECNSIVDSIKTKVDAVLGKALSDNNYTTTEKTKLSGIASGATQNQSDVYLLNRTNHTGTQSSDTITEGGNKFYTDARVQAVGDARYASLTGAYVNPSWITSIPWSKITTTPTTLSGYGLSTDFNTIGDARYIKLSGNSTLSGTLIVSSNTAPQVSISAPAGTTVQHVLIANAGSVRDVVFQTGVNGRWTVRADGTSEAGSNAGSDFSIISRNDVGSPLNTTLFIKRSTGNVNIGNAADNGFKLDVNGSFRAVGNINMTTAGSRLLITEGTNGIVGQTTLVAGTKAISIAGLTTSSRAIITLVTPTGTTLTVAYQGVCTAGTLTIQANIAAGTINTADTSVLNYLVIN